MHVRRDIEVYIALRTNVHARYGKEYALNIRIVGRSNWWTIHTWDGLPSQCVIDDYLSVAMRAIRCWHNRTRPTESVGAIKRINVDEQ